VNRAHWQTLAEERVLDANQLLQAGRWSGAYHLIGYAVECGLKACVLAHIENNNADVIFRERKFSENCWTHNIEDLVRLAGLRTVLDLDMAANRPLGVNWVYATQWKEISRYQTATEFNARRLVQAVTDAADGVLPWIRARW
jgi:hypothetical protein